jgi:hypothetical protein
MDLATAAASSPAPVKAKSVVVSRVAGFISISDGDRIGCFFPLSKVVMLALDEAGSVIINAGKQRYVLKVGTNAQNAELFDLIKKAMVQQ